MLSELIPLQVPTNLGDEVDSAVTTLLEHNILVYRRTGGRYDIVFPGGVHIDPGLALHQVVEEAERLARKQNRSAA